ncbi:hypothetical protein [Blastococcus brunescens]|uniref:Ppx/GppA phosphatase domain-containing protein n=1 Tax=Blastococcus brunescens TaxID=1564165 RepID=A0ABZ1AX99_9ACTN|nr:hypothetical protein [Blastococcus sp. BMG 8361]WRL63187.1 hypothetical protein U6N30_25900 [Blastococcus sp. BMG 8361]
MRLGVLDVGSNTVHLLVVDAHRGGHPTPMHDDRWLLRLAEQIGDDGLLSKAGRRRCCTRCRRPATRRRSRAARNCWPW